MPTIIDALAVELSLDPAKLKKGISEAIDDMRKMKEAAEKHGKDVEKSNKDAAEGFGLVTRRIGELAAAYLSFTAIKTFVNDIVQQNVALNSQAAALGVSIEKLSSMNNMARMVGSSAQGMTAAIASVQQQLVMMNQFHMPPSQEFLIGATMLGIPTSSYLGKNVTPDSLMIEASRAAHRALSAGQSQAAVSQELQKMGFSDPGMIAAMTQRSPEELKRYIEEMKKLAPSQQDVAAAQNLNMEWSKMTAAWDKFGSDTLPRINAEFAPVLGFFGKMAEWLDMIVNKHGLVGGTDEFKKKSEEQNKGGWLSGWLSPGGYQWGKSPGASSGGVTPGPSTSGATGIPSEILSKAREVALSGGPGAVQQFMSSQGYPMDGNWCGEFAASVVRGSGGTPPKDPAIASNWRNWGSPVSGAPQPGDIAVRRGPPTGSTGSHVTIVENYDASKGRFVGIGGNQGRFESNFSASQYDFRRGTSGERTVRGSTFDDAQTASGISPDVPGIALPDKSTLGQTFRVTTPDGRSFTAKQTDVGPAAWTKRGIDINRPLANQMGYGTKNFPTDQPFKYAPVHGDEQHPAASSSAPWYENYWKNLKSGWGKQSMLHPALLHDSRSTHNVSTAETHIGYITVNTQATDARGIARDIVPMLKNRTTMMASNNMAGGPV